MSGASAAHAQVGCACTAAHAALLAAADCCLRHPHAAANVVTWSCATCASYRVQQHPMLGRAAPARPHCAAQPPPDHDLTCASRAHALVPVAHIGLLRWGAESATRTSVRRLRPGRHGKPKNAPHADPNCAPKNSPTRCGPRLRRSSGPVACPGAVATAQAAGEGTAPRAAAHQHHLHTSAGRRASHKPWLVWCRLQGCPYGILSAWPGPQTAAASRNGLAGNSTAAADLEVLSCAGVLGGLAGVWCLGCG
jgi:hypothetical protein